MKVVALVSGGKDSCFAMMRCIDYGHEIVALANLMPADDSVDELDSYMYQTVGHQIVASYAECMGLPLFRRRIRGCTREQRLNYAMTPGDEVEDMFILLNEVKKNIPSITAVCSGAIASDYQRLRVESVCSRLGLVSLAYLWKQDQTLLLNEMIKRGIVAIIVKVAAMGLRPAEHIGRELVDLRPHLLELKELYGINVCGEGGEYETLTLYCPLFTNARIVLEKFEVILHSPDSIAPVGILHPLDFHLEYKKVDSSCNCSANKYKKEVSCCNCSDKNAGMEKINYLHEVEGDFAPNYLVKCSSSDLSSSITTTCKKLDLFISTTRRDMFSIGCWIQNPSRTSDGLQEDLAAVLRNIELQLKKDGFDWANVLYIHLYITNMREFGLANEVYVKFITEKKCYLGVPSRCTIELPLLHVGLGHGYVEVLVANEHCKRVLHVQSISSWAPSCIGPYSQATLYKEVLYMAGQLGLDPPTMTLCPGNPTSELEQALLNCDAVANCFSCSIASSTILFVVYCSAYLTSSEMTEIQCRMERFSELELPDLHHLRRLSAPIFLYILAPDLPKQARIEVKPVLYIPDNINGEFQSRESELAFKKITNTRSSVCPELHDLCCQIHVVSGKICAALISITNELAGEICSTTDQNVASFLSGTEKHIKIISTYCVVLLDKILTSNNFLWDELINLRIYYRTDLSVSAEIMSLRFSEAFSELAKVNGCLQVGGKPIFNLVPVLGSGSSASMEDIITCELFASKL